MRTAVFFLAFVAAVLFGFGCARSNSSAANNGKYYAVTTESTAFYHYGPQQGNGPDKKLPRDTLMTLIRPSFGYAKVKLVTGEEGFVSSDDIHSASSNLIAAVNATPTPAPSLTHVNYPEPKLPTSDPTAAFEPTPIPAPPGTPN